MRRIGLFLTMIIFSVASYAQSVILEGYVFEEGNRGYLNTARVVVEDKSTGEILGETFSNTDGFFTIEVDQDTEYELHVSKDFFEETDVSVQSGSDQKVFAEVPMKRSPGYMFELTLADEKTDENLPADGIRNTLIEVYNNTTQEAELELPNHPEPEFRVHLQDGNHYTILIRKNGYLAKKIEAFVNVDGCILCVEGLGKFGPGVSDNLTEGNQFGVLLANVEMEKVFEGKTMEIENLYYDLDKAFIRPDAAVELDKVVALMKYNRRLTVELGSHTDSRASNEYNMDLSERRAESAVDYIVKNGITRDRISARGYGETRLVNECADGVQCTEAQHQKNRRTEITVLGIDVGMEFIPLKELKRIEELENKAISGQLSEQVTGEELNKILTAEEIEKSAGEPADEETVNKEDTEEIIEHEEVKSKSEGLKDPTKPTVSVTTPEVLDGIKVVVLSVPERITQDHKVYSDFDNIRVFERPHNKGIYYFVPGYNTREQATQAMEDGKFADYPEAFIVEFKQGRIVD